jgi:hypothetical protein
MRNDALILRIALLRDESTGTNRDLLNQTITEITVLNRTIAMLDKYTNTLEREAETRISFELECA